MTIDAEKIRTDAEADQDFARRIAVEERERIRAAFMRRFTGAGEVYFDYLHGDEEAERCAAQFWNEVLEEIAKEAPCAIPQPSTLSVG